MSGEMISEETIHYVTNKLIPIAVTNNLAARIIVVNNLINKNNLIILKEEQIFSIRKLAVSNTEHIESDVMEKIHEIADYFESMWIALELQKNTN